MALIFAAAVVGCPADGECVLEEVDRLFSSPEFVVQPSEVVQALEFVRSQVIFSCAGERIQQNRFGTGQIFDADVNFSEGAENGYFDNFKVVCPGEFEAFLAGFQRFRSIPQVQLGER